MRLNTQSIAEKGTAMHGQFSVAQNGEFWETDDTTTDVAGFLNRAFFTCLRATNSLHVHYPSRIYCSLPSE